MAITETTPYAVACVIMRGGKVLLLRRGETAPRDPGVWALPGGVVNDGETPDDAVVREVQEETGLAVLASTYVATHRLAADGKRLEIYAARDPGGHVVLSQEHDDFGWFEWRDQPEHVAPIAAKLLKAFTRDEQSLTPSGVKEYVVTVTARPGEITRRRIVEARSPEHARYVELFDAPAYPEVYTASDDPTVELDVSGTSYVATRWYQVAVELLGSERAGVLADLTDDDRRYVQEVRRAARHAKAALRALQHAAQRTQTPPPSAMLMDIEAGFMAINAVSDYASARALDVLLTLRE